MAEAVPDVATHTPIAQTYPVAPVRAESARFRTFVQIFLLWTAIALAFATQLYFAGLPWTVALSWTLPRWYAWGLVTPGVFWMDRRLAATSSIGQRIGWHLPAGVMWTTVTIVLRLVARPFRGSTLPDDFSAYFLDRFYSDLPIYAVIAGISFARTYAERVKDGERRARELALHSEKLERHLIESRLQSLRAQLQPHFLFNALNTISAFTESNPSLARRLMAQLGDLLRASLTHAATPLVTLGEELTFLDDYIQIESARFEGRLRVSVDANDELLSAKVPSFLLQPLVENAIRHGVGPRLSGGHVDVRATARDGGVTLSVNDDGVGLPTGWTFRDNAGVGVRNVSARLEHLYGRSDLLQILPRPGGGLTVQVDIPRSPAAGIATDVTGQ